MWQMQFNSANSDPNFSFSDEKMRYMGALEKKMHWHRNKRQKQSVCYPYGIEYINGTVTAQTNDANGEKLGN